MSKQKDKFYEYIEKSLNNKQSKFECEVCNEADNLMFKIIKINTDTLKPLNKTSYNLCRFCARNLLTYYFRKVRLPKFKQETLFEAEV